MRDIIVSINYRTIKSAPDFTHDVQVTHYLWLIRINGSYIVFRVLPKKTDKVGKYAKQHALCYAMHCVHLAKLE